MEKITLWNAKRSGGRITIKGVDPDDSHPVKVSNVDTIELVDGKVIATDKDGDTFELVA